MSKTIRAASLRISRGFDYARGNGEKVEGKGKEDGIEQGKG